MKQRLDHIYKSLGIPLAVPATLFITLWCSLPMMGSAPLSSDLNPKIAASAKSSLGKEMWHGYGLKTGFLGCAAAVCNVLEAAGIKRAHSAAVSIMRNQLIKSSYEEFTIKNGTKVPIDDRELLKFSKPGDILVAFVESPEKPNLGGNAHCGIMGDTNTVYTNDWNDGIWKAVNIHVMFDYYRHVRLIRLKTNTK